MYYIDGLAQDSIADALEVLQSCVKPSILLSHGSESLSLHKNSLWIGVVTIKYFDRI